METESLAVFTHNEISITDNLVLTLGVRYSQETKDLTASLNAVNPTCASLQLMEANTSAATPTPGGIVSAIQATAAGATAMALACSPAVNPIANGNYAGDREENEFSGTASLAYHINDDRWSMQLVARLQSGGYNIDRWACTPASTSASAANVSSPRLPEFTDAWKSAQDHVVRWLHPLQRHWLLSANFDYQLNALTASTSSPGTCLT